MILSNTEGLRKLILENPDLPICVLVNSEVVLDDSYTSWCAPEVRYYLGQVLDCTGVDENKIYDDPDDLRDDFIDMFYSEYEDKTDDEIFAMADEKMKEFEGHWVKCIQIYATT